ncbi:Histone-lysine N-methyltransferase SETMAR [Araneus ventricosus]|uniref:Histone-lysine N-methyltransferase SETMAR n=1 Tax=Araneus ventricosus TaxID=182803 RepID=A0A4Y2URP4_ARAVE|nr:Histone-lysine N-methyltransferase SETMAR [Araneus ventricosus]
MLAAKQNCSCQKWFKKLPSGDFSLKDDQRSGRPTEVSDEQIKIKIESDRHIYVREIAERLNVSPTTIKRHLKRLEFAKKLEICVQHELKDIQLTHQINVCDMHLKRKEIHPFLERIIPGDEKWLVYNNTNRKRS